MRVSLRSLAVGLVGLGTVAIIRTVIVLDSGESRMVMTWVGIGQAIVLATAAGIVITVAKALTRNSGRSEWLLLGTGMALFAMSGFVRVWLRLSPSAEVPFPGLPDIFSLASYVCFAVALFIAASKRRAEADPSSAALITGLAAASALGAVYLGLVEPLVASEMFSPGGLALSVIYPVADVTLMASPAIFLLIIVYRLRDRGALFAWAFVAVGVSLLAVTDAAFSWLRISGGHVPGHMVEYGGMLSMIALAVGASVAHDAAAVWETPGVAAARTSTTGAYGVTEARPPEDDPWNSPPLL